MTAETQPLWPEGLDHIWAKSSPVRGQAGQSLAQHTWETLSRLSELAHLRPCLSVQAGLPGLWQSLFFAAWLHDWGKTARGFQQMLRGGPKWRLRHEVLSLAFVDWFSVGLTLQETSLLAAAVATHHRDLNELLDGYLTELDPEDDPLFSMLDELATADLAALWGWVNRCSQGWICRLAMQELGVGKPRLPDLKAAIGMVREEGAVRIRKHLHAAAGLSAPLAALPLAGYKAPTSQSLPELVPFEEEAWVAREPGEGEPAGLPEEPPLTRVMGIFLRGSLVQADHLASAGSGPLPAGPLGSQAALLARSGLQWSSLYRHQADCARQTGCVVLSAPTGSGKTEAALLWALRQRLRRVFYTLPYQASMNAMYDRLGRVFPGQTGLLHGRSTLSLYQRWMEQEYTPQEAARRAREERNLAGLAYFPVRVFSPYQMLKAAFQLKGYEAFLTDFAQAAFVFDEIHAYEPGRLALIVETIGLLKREFAARFLVMSATMAAPIRQILAETLAPLAQVRAAPELYHQFRRHRLCLVQGELLDEANLERAYQAALAGQQVLVAANTVRRAQTAWQWLHDRQKAASQPAIPVYLLHGRFHGLDRARIERQILEQAGLNARRQPLILVATQVVEVSLNLDLDVLFSDPAPLDALWQRFGRVNRLRRLELAPVYVFRQPVEFRQVYPPGIVERSLAVLEAVLGARAAAGLPVDEAQVQDWLDTVYDGQALQAWQDEYRAAAGEFRQAFIDPLAPFQSLPGLEAAFERLFDGLEVLPLELHERYEELRQGERALEAAQLLAPLGWGQFHYLANQGRVLPNERGQPYLVDAPYGQAGLLLEN